MAHGYLNKTQLTTIHKRLLNEKEKLINKEYESDTFCLDKNELSDVLDEASINIQASQELRFRNRELFYLKKVEQALDRVKRGLYGRCEECDGPISYERLMARPTAELCIGCKECAETGEKNNYFQNKSKSLGKTILEIGSP